MNNKRRGKPATPNTKSTADVYTQDDGHLEIDKRQGVCLDQESLEAIRLLVRTELDESLNLLKKEILELRTSNEMMKNVIISQQLQIEKMELDKRACNLIIHGVQEATAKLPDKHMVDNILETIRSNCTDSDPPTKFEVTNLRRIGKHINGTKPRPIVLTLTNRDNKNLILKKSKSLRNVPGFSNVYLSADLPDLTRRENGRLRMAFKQLKDSSSESSVLLRSGKLSIDGRIVDSFNIKNQLFRAEEQE